MPRIARLLSLLVLTTIALSGCSSGPTFATVEGQVKVNGEPARKVRIEFHPDATRGTKGPSSTAETDAEGRFTLTYSSPQGSGKGAVVGWHKVVLQDLRLAESETGHGVPVRFGSEYATVLTTPLDQEVKAGHQTLTIEVPRR